MARIVVRVRRSTFEKRSFSPKVPGANVALTAQCGGQGAGARIAYLHGNGIQCKATTQQLFGPPQSPSPHKSHGRLSQARGKSRPKALRTQATGLGKVGHRPVARQIRIDSLGKRVQVNATPLPDRGGTQQRVQKSVKGEPMFGPTRWKLESPQALRDRASQVINDQDPRHRCGAIGVNSPCRHHQTTGRVHPGGMPCDFDLQGSADAKQDLCMLVRMRATLTVIAPHQGRSGRNGVHAASLPTVRTACVRRILATDAPSWPIAAALVESRKKV